MRVEEIWAQWTYCQETSLRYQFYNTWVLWHGLLSCWKQPSEHGTLLQLRHVHSCTHLKQKPHHEVPSLSLKHPPVFLFRMHSFLWHSSSCWHDCKTFFRFFRPKSSFSVCEISVVKELNEWNSLVILMWITYTTTCVVHWLWVQTE